VKYRGSARVNLNSLLKLKNWERLSTEGPDKDKESLKKKTSKRQKSGKKNNPKRQKSSEKKEDEGQKPETGDWEMRISPVRGGRQTQNKLPCSQSKGTLVKTGKTRGQRKTFVCKS